MATALHLLTAGDATRALPVIARQHAEGTAVRIALLPGATAPPLPDGIIAERVGDDLPYERLLDLIFESDQVVAW